MDSPATRLIVGNWKMNGLRCSLREVGIIAALLRDQPADADVILCPPSTLIGHAAELAAGGLLAIGAQDCHDRAFGAFTGELSAEMVADAGARAVILGHSERRCSQGETDEVVARKAEAALRAGLFPIICVGESLAQRQCGGALEAIAAQLSRPELSALKTGPFAVAYEPCWAIGTGLTPTLEEIEYVHDFIRGVLAARFGRAGRATRILYGGSVRADNARDILHTPQVGGVLVGGASLCASEFMDIVRANQAQPAPMPRWWGRDPRRSTAYRAQL